MSVIYTLAQYLHIIKYKKRKKKKRVTEKNERKKERKTSTSSSIKISEIENEDWKGWICSVCCG